MGTSVALGETQRERCFTPVFCVAVSLRANQPVHTEAQLSHSGYTTKRLVPTLNKYNYGYTVFFFIIYCLMSY